MAKKEKVPLGAFTKEEDIKLIREFDKYLEQINKNRTSNKVSRLNFFSNAIKRELAGKVLTNDYITLKEPQYINTTDLLTNKKAEATTEKPSSDLLNQMVLFKVPNNLDKWNNNYNTFCSEDERHSHEGIKPIVALLGSDKNNKIKILYHVFKLDIFYNDTTNKKLQEYFHLEVSIIEPEELEIFLNQYPEEIAESLLEEFKAFEEEVANDIDSGLTNKEISNKYFEPSVLRMLNYNQNVENAVDLVNNVANTLFSSINKILPITKEVHEKGVENLTTEELEEYEEKLDKSNAVQNLFNLKSFLNIRNLKTLHKVNKELKENPDNPVTKMLDNVTTTLEEAIDNPEANPEEVVKDVAKYMAEESLKIKEGVDTEFITSTLENSNANEEFVEMFSGMAEAESVEDVFTSFSNTYGVDINEVIDVEKKE